MRFQPEEKGPREGLAYRFDARFDREALLVRRFK
jgi:hypothetical protein